MSIVTKRVTGKEYVYFQTYRSGKRVDFYIGPANDPMTWIQARDKIRDYRQKETASQLEAVDEKIAEQLKLTRRRLLQSSKKVSTEKLAESLDSALSSPTITATYSPVLKSELEKMLRELREKRSSGG